MTDILPEDRDAAERIAMGQPFTCFDCADELRPLWAGSG